MTQIFAVLFCCRRILLYPPQLRFFSSPGGVRIKGQQEEVQAKHQHLDWEHCEGQKYMR